MNSQVHLTKRIINNCEIDSQKGGAIIKNHLQIASSNKEDEKFLHIELLITNTERNQNNQIVTKGFIDRLVERADDFTGTPLVCDTASLKIRGVLDHKLNRHTQEFDTQQIGSFIGFRSDIIDGKYSLIGLARVPKRHEQIVNEIIELDRQRKLLFSYEIVAEEVVHVSGVDYITESDKNYLIGVAIVSKPAVEEAKALLVASEENSIEGDAEELDTKEKDTGVEIAEETTVVEEEKEEVVIEEEKVTLKAEEVVVEKDDTEKEMLTMELDKTKAELAEMRKELAEIHAEAREKELMALKHDLRVEAERAFMVAEFTEEEVTQIMSMIDNHQPGESLEQFYCSLYVYLIDKLLAKPEPEEKKEGVSLTASIDSDSLGGLYGKYFTEF